MGKRIGFIGLTLVAACSGEDPYEPTYSQRSATGSECSAGGSVLLVDGEAQVTTCNGVPGEPGLAGQDGARGAQGERGAMGAPGGVGPAGDDAEGFSRLTTELAPFAESLVGVICCDAESLCAAGSGVKTSATRISTARHVIEDMTACSIVSGNDSSFIGMSTALFVSTTGADAAEIEITVPGPVVPSVVAYQPVLGEPVIVVGRPDTGLGTPVYENQYTFGHVTATNLAATLAAAAITGWPNSFSIDAVAWHGNSGGAVFNEDGVCIGMLVGALNGGPENAGPDTAIVLPFPQGS